jgi:ribosomal-protein-alanine N-acetyltransferase
MTQILQTARLGLRQLESADAAFILELLNDPSWLQFIGDKGVRSLGAAELYIEQGPRAMYARFGFGLYLVESNQTSEPMGLCGLLKRETLDAIDLGFAFLPRFRGKGYAHEAAEAVLSDAQRRLGIDRIVAITSPDNQTSGRLLQKLGFALERTMRLAGDSHEVLLYSRMTQ